jgi:hypothetical protein
MSPPTKPLTGKKAAAVLHLASGMSNESAAAAVKVSPRTIQRWKLAPDFVAELKALRAQLRGDASERVLDMMARLLAPSADVLAQSLKSQNERVKLGAVEAIFAWYSRLFEQHVLAQEVGDLRRLVEADHKSRRRHAAGDPSWNGRAYR